MIRQRWRQFATWIALTSVAVTAAFLILRPDPYDVLRQADERFAVGQYRAALAIYDTIALPHGEAALRRGIVFTVRGEIDLAHRAFIAAMKAGLRPRDYQLATLYFGHLAVLEDDSDAARRAWQMLTLCDPDRCAVRDLLLADEALRAGQFAEAWSTYQTIRVETLPVDWASFFRNRQALLAALFGLPAIPEAPAPSATLPPDPFLRPLLPPTPDPAILAATLIANPTARPQLLGQIALDLGYDRLALAFFDQVDPAGPHGLAAAIYRAYAHLRLGNQQQGIVQLEQLATAHPADLRIGSLLALAYLQTGDLVTAAGRLQQLRDTGATGPALALAQAGLALAQRDFVAAADAYEQAVIAAPSADRARYVTLAARFHLDSGFERCTSGLQAAQAAANLLPRDPETLTILAGIRYYCGDVVGARAAATAAIEVGAGVEARFYYGLALSAGGDPARGRAALEQVADQAPASPWRRRAETALALIGGK
ncbi:tetratricopeptide repeat protein [Chloroflexus sp.]|uniref:tetratricopeptide repeat protein n=1 Tax=Chloroflexus sp. TaxID=1904827 RepID=UPI00261201B7|nr:tetratricopeptide repeat protein [uncultured Chloroflexus sp.]